MTRHAHPPLGPHLASLSAFELSAEALKAAVAPYELAQACGALLMLEAAFAQHPFLIESLASSDHEGGYLLDLKARAPDGSTALCSDILLALYHDSESTGLTDDERARIGQDSPWANPALCASFRAIGIDPIEQAESMARLAYDHLHHNARALFYRQCDSTAFGGDAPTLGRALGLDQAASAIEAARIEAECQPAPSSGPALSL